MTSATMDVTRTVAKYKVVPRRTLSDDYATLCRSNTYSMCTLSKWLSKAMTFEGDSALLAKFVSDNEKAEDAPRPLTPLNANLDQPCSTGVLFATRRKGAL